MTKGIKKTGILKISAKKVEQAQDSVAVEAPLEIKIHAAGAHPPILNKNISITMCTPGEDVDLALGFLFTEGIISTFDQVERSVASENGITVFLNTVKPIDLSKIDRHSYSNSSCGVCGKSSLNSLKIKRTLPHTNYAIKIDKELIKRFPALVKEQQNTFQHTGGLHAAGLFDLQGNLILLREDVGRHNALDKLIGACFTLGKLPLNQHILFLSGRTSFELLQKAAMAGISVVLAVGAPSSMAVETAIEFDITLVGFLNEHRFNVYHGAKRLGIF